MQDKDNYQQNVQDKDNHQQNVQDKDNYQQNVQDKDNYQQKCARQIIISKMCKTKIIISKNSIQRHRWNHVKGQSTLITVIRDHIHNNRMTCIFKVSIPLCYEYNIHKYYAIFSLT
jgi:hypothetical protein